MKTTLHQSFKFLPDPRIEHCKKHLFIEMIILSVLAALSGAESYDSIELYGKINIRFLKKILKLPNGIPSHDTINRVFSVINSKEFERLFIEWTATLKSAKILRDVIAIDGKTIRGSKDSYHKKSPVHLVHAWSVENNLCLGQIKTNDKSNEITAIPELLDIIEIKGSVVSIDAMGTQTSIADKIIDSGADYILAVKNNQQTLREDIEHVCRKRRPVAESEEIEKSHGRIESRYCKIFENNNSVDSDRRWNSLRTIIQIISTRETGESKTTQTRYYISSLRANEPFNRYIKDHWSVENKLHWVLDVVFLEDMQRKRDKNSAQNFAIVRKIVLNLLKKDKGKESLKSKRLKAGWNNDFLLELITNL
ncbi:MAG: ISAs1 family transposase [Bacteroidales bacterium]|jgi:predicted transposase YbfD/YdcC|nr:ISAs1 family transposase [Bacteroidales bacterium]